MILEAFSKELQAKRHEGNSPERILFDWLLNILLWPPAPDDHVAKVIHAEIAFLDCNGHPAFEGKSDTGHQLLESLYKFCRSFDHWQFTRWLHEIRASDFSEAANS